MQKEFQAFWRDSFNQDTVIYYFQQEYNFALFKKSQKLPTSSQDYGFGFDIIKVRKYVM